MPVGAPRQNTTIAVKANPALATLPFAPLDGTTLIACAVYASGTSAVVSIAQSAGTVAWTRLATIPDATTGLTVDWWIALNVQGAGTGVSFTVPGLNVFMAVIAEWPGIVSASALDISHTAVNVSGSSTTCDSGLGGTTAIADELWLTCMASINRLFPAVPVLSAPTNGYTILNQVGYNQPSAGSGLGLGFCYKIATAVGTPGNACTLVVPTSWNAIAISLKGIPSAPVNVSPGGVPSSEAWGSATLVEGLPQRSEDATLPQVAGDVATQILQYGAGGALIGPTGNVIATKNATVQVSAISVNIAEGSETALGHSNVSAVVIPVLGIAYAPVVIASPQRNAGVTASAIHASLSVRPSAPGLVKRTSFAATHISISMAPANEIATEDSGDTITPNAGLIFAETPVTVLKTDAELGAPVGISFAVIRQARRGIPSWLFKRSMQVFCEYWGIPYGYVQANFKGEHNKAWMGTGKTGLTRVYGGATGYMGLADPPVPSVYVEGQPYPATSLGSSALIDAPAVGSQIDASIIKGVTGKIYTYLEVIGGYVFVTLDGRRAGPDSCDLIIGQELVLQGGGGSAGSAGIDEFEPVGSSYTAAEAASRGALMEFVEPLIEGDVFVSYNPTQPLRVRPDAIGICRGVEGTQYRAVFLRVGE